MKARLLITLTSLFMAIIPLTSSAFVELVCEHGNKEFKPNSGDLIDSIKVEQNFKCISASGKSYEANYNGYGIHQGGSYFKGLTITCPNVRAKALGRKTYINWRGQEKNGVANFVGVKSEVAVGAGVEAGVVVNKYAGACVILGLSFYGEELNVSGGLLEIKRND